MDPLSTTASLLGAGLLAGMMNAVAGGGTFVTLPVLVLVGVPSVTANASSTVALLPGGLASAWAYREDLASPPGASLRELVGVSLAGGLVGSLLLLLTPPTAFERLLPWLLLGASGVFALGPRLGGALRRRSRVHPRALLVVQFVLALYGGYFGGAVGILMMAGWSLMGSADLKVFNPLKTLLVAAANATAAACFVVLGAVSWPQTLVVMGAAGMGGYAGARLARKLDARHLRLGVTVLCLLLTLAFFARARWTSDNVRRPSAPEPAPR